MASILIVEDEFLIALDLEAEVARLGHAAHLASSLSQAEEHLAGSRIDAAILDINLGGDTSFALADRFLANGKPFFFLSGNDPSGLPAHHRQSTVLTKPVDRDLFEQALARIVQQ